MRALVLLCLSLVALGAANEAADRALFEDFKRTYGRQYTGGEEVTRFLAFQQSLREAERLNANTKDTAVYGVTPFSDLTKEEFGRYHNMKAHKEATEHLPLMPRPTQAQMQAAANTTLDWRTKGAVTHVKNQGQCGSCWAFSATGNMEAVHFLAGNKLIALSEEQLVQCEKTDAGCNGGLQENAFKYVLSNKGINSEEAYPYTSGRGVSGTCKKEKEGTSVAKFSSWKRYTRYAEKELEAQLAAHGPIAISVDAAVGWQSYQSGIMRTCIGWSLDHGVLLVGYGGETEGERYWIVKNSWGPSWGESGYIRLARGTNQCGLADDPVTAEA